MTEIKYQMCNRQGKEQGYFLFIYYCYYLTSEEVVDLLSEAEERDNKEERESESRRRL